MKNRDYWRRRFEILEQASVNQGQDYLHTLDREFRTAMARVEGELSKWYQRFANNNGITFTEAKRWLNAKELEEFRWSVEDYIRYGQENALSGQWAKQLENASARVHISRLEALQLEIQQNVEALYGNQLDGMDALARKIYTDGYYRTAYEIQHGFNVGWDLTPLNRKQLDRVISKPWTLDRETFSDRIWDQKSALVARVQTELTQSILRGDSPDKAIRAISEQFRVSKNQAARLVMTESAYFASEAQQHCFKELGVERYEIVATLDGHTSELCQSLDGKVMPMGEYEPGVTAPPFHPWCRTVTAPYFDDNYGERAARDPETGKTYHVPAEMTYPEWKKTFVENADHGNGLTGRASGAKVGDTDGYTTIDDIREINFNDNVAVQHEIEAFREKFKDDGVEHAIVISQSGKVYELTGMSGSVNPAIVGAEELKGSIGAHNHPVPTGYDRGDSFSWEDLSFSARHKTGMEYLVSGNRRDAFLYTGDLSEDELYWAYEKAKKAAQQYAWDNDIETEWEKADFFRELSKTLEGLTFYEKL